ncbi:putative component of NuA3 histone acetyltransferase complex [Coemansia javaensis]|uniref:Component of NuA3 histone acetyltransferase complex n=1 Tax=Coemansia javaensis TaxID=2761396 RepID=A0A9W8HBV5_9FUNG|nr:putative component of NuA3 histone acetyltransferase complex [Coemansia javaensis]
MDDGQSAKRARTAAAACFPAGLLASGDERGRAYRAAEPFPHHSIAPFCAEELLRGVREELVGRLHFTHKETDIFKYHQSGDLANLDGLPAAEQARLPCLRRLRDAIYSAEFRAFVSAVTGCGPLSGSRTDMSTNRFKPGDHLLLHDDAIGDRRVSYIIYLPDPDAREWTPADGGHLELYPRESRESWAPAARPACRVPPRWNQMVLFVVHPGQSHHSVEEVCAGERVSIQGWFHFPQPGEPGYAPDQMQRAWAGGAESTLSQIAARAQRRHASLPPFAPAPAPAQGPGAPERFADSAPLARFVNAEYLDPEIMRQAADRFADDSHISLAAFLNEPTAAALERALREADAQDGIGPDRHRIPAHGTGESGPWSAAGPPVVRRYLRLGDAAAAAGAPPDAAARLLAALRDELFATPAFARWLAAVTGLALGARRGSVRRFRPGLDYTLASPAGDDAPVLDAVLCLAARPAAWVDGTVGGYHCYLDAGSDDDEASNDGSVYRATAGDDNDAVLLTNPAAWNTLCLAMREPGVVHFVKYVSAAAPGSRWDVSYEFQISEEEDGDDDD